MGPLFAVMAWAPWLRAARMWSTAGWPFSTLRDVASKRTSAWADFSHVWTLVECGADFPEAGEGARSTYSTFSTFRPLGLAIQQRRRDAIPVMRNEILWRVRSSGSRSFSKCTRVRLTLP